MSQREYGVLAVEFKRRLLKPKTVVGCLVYGVVGPPVDGPPVASHMDSVTGEFGSAKNDDAYARGRVRARLQRFWNGIEPVWWRGMRASRAAGGASNDHLYLPPGAIPPQHPIVTFVPNRDEPIYTHIQNDGSLVSSSDAFSLKPVHSHRKINQPRARRDPPPPLSQHPGRYTSEVTRRIEAKRKAQPSSEELILQSLRQGLRTESSRGTTTAARYNRALVPQLASDVPQEFPNQRREQW
ncbi:hypothetical protein B0H16DRAFT_1448402 [Mycena metata]|uniref:Uncharacterized protein n=1 Tax=Mycena metata TaxID=1033252 RepID=A0AAD7NXL8_9AGAR|nr:hypothetical protein B0H16DRAFT_1448402 [Mycena metata]